MKMYFLKQVLPYQMTMGPPSSVAADDLPTDDALLLFWDKLIAIKTISLLDSNVETHVNHDPSTLTAKEVSNVIF